MEEEDHIKIKWENISEKVPEFNKFTIELQKLTKDISNRIASIRFVLNAILEIYNTPDIYNKIQNYKVLAMMENTFVFKYLITMNNIFDSGSYYCIIKLINTVNNEYKRISWYEAIPKSDLPNITDYFNSEKLKTIITNIKTLRDKRLAHEENIELNIEIDLKDLVYLQDKLEAIFNKLRFAIEGITTGFDQQEEPSLKLLIKNLSKFDNLQYTIYEAIGERKDFIETKQLSDIIKGQEPYKP